MDKKGEVGEIILVENYQPHWTILVKPVYWQASIKSTFFFLFAVLVGFVVGLVFFGWLVGLF